eukprot:jgi/Tetstr1/462866/TSEL_007815.t1
MGVGEDPVGEDGMDIDAPAWPPADVEAADEGVIRKGDPGDFYMKVIAKKFRGVWHYGVITGVVTEWVLEDYGGATQWRAVFDDGDIVDLLRSEVVEAMAAAQEHPPVDADGEARLVTVHEGDDLSSESRTLPGVRSTQPGWRRPSRNTGCHGVCHVHVVMGYVSMVNLFPLAPFHLFFFGLGREFWRKFVTVQGHIGFQAMKQEDRRQALVPIPSNFGRGLRPSFAVSKKSKGSGKVTVQSGWVMEDCLHHMETFSILNAGPLFEEARVKAIMTEKELASPAVVRSASRLAVLGHMYKRLQGAAWFITRWGLQNVVTEEDGPERKAQVDALTREGRTRYPARRQRAAAGAARSQGARPGQHGAKARRPGQRGAKARRPGQRGAKARGRGSVAPTRGGRGSAAPTRGGRGSAAPRRGGRGSAAPRRGGRGSAAPTRGGRGSAAPTRVGWAGQRLLPSEA